MKRLAGAAVLVIALVGFFAIGRYSAPVRIQERERIVERQGATVHTQGETRYVRVADVRKDVRVVTRTEKRPDGTIIIRKLEQDRTEKRDATATLAKIATVETRWLTRDVEKLRITEAPRPRWSLGLNAGYRSLQARPNAIGVTAGMRVVGGLWLQVSGNTDRTAGIGVRYEF